MVFSTKVAVAAVEKPYTHDFCAVVVVRRSISPGNVDFWLRKPFSLYAPGNVCSSKRRKHLKLARTCSFSSVCQSEARFPLAPTLWSGTLAARCHDQHLVLTSQRLSPYGKAILTGVPNTHSTMRLAVPVVDIHDD